jgi:hypothetical protein
VRGHRYELSALEGEDSIQLGEAHVVTDRQSDLPVFYVCDDRFVARLLRLGFSVDDTADLHVEEVDLAIGRDELPRGVEDETRVRELLPSFAALG